MKDQSLSKIHVVALTGTLDRSGGAERAFRTIVDAFENRLGMDVSLVAHVPPNDPTVRERAAVLRPEGEPASFRMITRMRAIIDSAPRPALLFPFQMNSNIVASLANRLLPRSRRLPIVLNDRAAIDQLLAGPPGQSPLGQLRTRAVSSVARSAYRQANAVVCNAEANAERVRNFIHRPFPPVETIYNPLDAEGFQSRFPQRDRRIFQQTDQPLLVAHGRLHPQKGFDTLLRALASVRERGSPARLRLVGDGPERVSLESLVQALGLGDAVEMLGFSDDPWASIERGDVYVLPSRFEGLPNALLEAIALGLPSVAADCPTGPAEILTADSGAGRLVPVDDVEALSRTIEELLADGEARHAMGQAARRRALDFSLQANTDAYADVFERVLTASARPVG